MSAKSKQRDAQPKTRVKKTQDVGEDEPLGSEQRFSDATSCPAGWLRGTLGEILPLKYGKARNEQYGYLRPETDTFGSNGAFGKFDRALTYRPTLIVGRKGAAGAVHFSTDPCWPIDTAYYTEGSEDLHLAFFRYLLESLQLVQLDRSTAIPSLSRDDYNNHVVCFPQSLPEQRRIVAEIEKQFTRLDAGVAALKRVQSNLKRYRAAVLKAACEGKLVPTEASLARAEKRKIEDGDQLLKRILAERKKNWQGRGAYKEPAMPDTKDLPTLPEGWVYVAVETVGFVQLGRQRAPKHHTGKNMRPYLRVANVFEDRFDLSDVMEMNFTPEEYETFCLKPNDILLNEGQSLELVGRPAIYRDELPGACFTNTLVRFRPCPSLNVKFALSLFRAYMHSGRFQKIAKWTTNIAHLGSDRFAKLEFPLPPLAEQTRIVEEVERRLSVIEELETVVKANLQRAARLRQAVLQKAFKGELV